MTEWKKSKNWADKFTPEIQSICGKVFFSVADDNDDKKHNTDLLLTAKKNRVALRVRQHKYLKPYGHEFTIRSHRPNGAETELSKLMRGEGDYVFYAFANDEETRLEKWIIGDLDKLRDAIYKGAEFPTQTNADGVQFLAVPVYKVPDFVIAEGGDAHA